MANNEETNLEEQNGKVDPEVVDQNGERGTTSISNGDEAETPAGNETAVSCSAEENGVKDAPLERTVKNPFRSDLAADRGQVPALDEKSVFDMKELDESIGSVSVAVGESMDEFQPKDFGSDAGYNKAKAEDQDTSERNQVDSDKNSSGKEVSGNKFNLEDSGIGENADLVCSTDQENSAGNQQEPDKISSGKEDSSGIFKSNLDHEDSGIAENGDSVCPTGEGDMDIELHAPDNDESVVSGREIRSRNNSESSSSDSRSRSPRDRDFKSKHWKERKNLLVTSTDSSRLPRQYRGIYRNASPEEKKRSTRKRRREEDDYETKDSSKKKDATGDVVLWRIGVPTAKEDRTKRHKHRSRSRRPQRANGHSRDHSAPKRLQKGEGYRSRSGVGYHENHGRLESERHGHHRFTAHHHRKTDFQADLTGYGIITQIRRSGRTFFRDSERKTEVWFFNQDLFSKQEEPRVGDWVRYKAHKAPVPYLEEARYRAHFVEIAKRREKVFPPPDVPEDEVSKLRAMSPSHISAPDEDPTPPSFYDSKTYLERFNSCLRHTWVMRGGESREGNWKKEAVYDKDGKLKMVLMRK